MNYFVKVAALMAGGLVITACGSAPELGEEEGAPLGSAQESFTNSVALVGCGGETGLPAQRLRQASDFLANRIYENQGWSFRKCLADSFISYSNGEQWASEIATQFEKTGTTTYTCVSNLSTACGTPSDDVWGCARSGPENVNLTFQMINDPNVSIAQMAGLIAHELSHTYGHSHPLSSDGDIEYDQTVTQRVRACVENFNSLPFGQSRSNGMPAEVAIGPAGRLGGTPFEINLSDGVYAPLFARGLLVFTGSLVNGLAATVSNGSGSTAFFGGSSGTGVTRDCNAGEFMVGIHGRAGSALDSVGVHCGTAAGVTHSLPADGGTGGRPFDFVCPAGKAVRAIRGRATTSNIQQIQIVCDSVGVNYFSSHVPHVIPNVPMRGSTSGTQVWQRCSGNAAMTALVGRAGTGTGGRVDRLAGQCSPPGGPVHLTVPFVGGHGGTAFPPSACPSGELMVGISSRFSTSSLNAVRPLCAPPAQWEASGDGLHSGGTWVGGTSGSTASDNCPAGEFVVGLNTTSGGVVNGMSVVCASRTQKPTPPTCGVLAPGQSLPAFPDPNHRRLSCDGRFALAMQADGNLVLYQGATPLWASNTVGTGANIAAMQSDGNFVLYGPSGPVWATNTYGMPAAYLSIPNTGSISILRAPGSTRGGRVLWSSIEPFPSTACGRLLVNQGLSNGTSLTSCDGRFRLNLQLDGNLVLTQGSAPIWASNTAGKGNFVYAMLRSTGDFQLINRNPSGLSGLFGNTIEFSTGTANHPNAVLFLQNDGNLVLYDGSTPIWASNTCCR